MSSQFNSYQPLANYFDKIYIINLASRQDRRDEMEEQLNKIGLSISHAKINLFPAIRPDDFDGWPSLGAKGCFMSHYQVLLDAKSNGYHKILIFEDDLNFNNDFNATISSIIEQLKMTDWGIFYGGHELSRIEDDKLKQAYVNNVMLSKNLYAAPASANIICNHFVGLNQPTITALANYLSLIVKRPAGDPAGGPMHVDGAYSWFRREHHNTQTVLAYPQLGYQRSSRTDIHSLSWFDSLPIISSFTKTIRKFNNQSYRP